MHNIPISEGELPSMAQSRADLGRCGQSAHQSGQICQHPELHHGRQLKVPAFGERTNTTSSQQDERKQEITLDQKDVK